jgi:hypothetical protein
MALKTDKAVEVFTALHMKEIKSSEIEVQEARAAIRELAKNPNPSNRYELSQLMAYVVNDIINQKTNYIDLVGDVKRVAVGEKAMFKVKKSGINAFLQAKNGTTQRSRILNSYETVDTIEVSARPYVNLYELAAGKVNFDECIADAADEMEKKMVQNLESTLYAAFDDYSSPSYSSGSGIVAATIDPMIRAMQRLGSVTITGDINAIVKFNDLTGFTAATSTYQFNNEIIKEANDVGHIGGYKGSKIVKMNNPFERGSLSTTILNQGLVYIIPSGVTSPFKVVMEGDVESMDATNINDNTMDVCLRKYFGSAVIYGDNPYISVYEDTAL